ncbi:MAG: prepilin-type N-terminal cleavage/methylation domain-containing protein [Kiritimatiellia bacterium]
MKQGFSLIELVVVLTILALLTHLAVRELGGIRQDKLHQMANRQLEAIQAAVWREQPDGEPAGFLVDMGRLPVAREETNRWGEAVQTLSELWKRPAGVPEFALRPATVSNLVAGADAESLADPSLSIPCGWRGPYLRLPFGGERLADPWGNPMETPDGAGFARLTATNGSAVVAGAVVGAVGHWGSDARPDGLVAPADAFARDAVCLLVPGAMRNTLFVTAAFSSVAEDVDVAGSTVAWYMPCGGAITGAVVSAQASGATATYTCEGLPPGVCTVVVRDGENVKRAVQRVVVPPGGRAVQMRIRLD